MYPLQARLWAGSGCAFRIQGSQPECGVRRLRNTSGLGKTWGLLGGGELTGG